MAVDIRVAGIPNLTDLPVQYKDALSHMTGLGEWRKAAEADGYTEDHVNTNVIPAVIRAAERAIQSFILPTRIVPDTMLESDPLIADSPYNYLRYPPNQLRSDMGWGYFAFYAPIAPILAVHRLRIVANPHVPVFTIPIDWVVWDRETGLVSLQPATVAANAGQLSTGSMILSITTLGREWLPQGIELVYDVGLPEGWQNGFFYADMKRYLSKKVALEVLNNLTEVFDAGRQSVSGSAFGVNTSINYERFVRLRGELTLQTEKFENDYVSMNQGIRVGGA